jgi:predicted DsbA family dithiol-disulfide isomerase
VPAPRLDLWLDYNCPYCYAGLASAELLRERVEAEVFVHPFELHPEYPPDGLPRSERDGGLAPVQLEGWSSVIAAAGLPPRNQPERIANTQTALALTVYAATQGASYPLAVRLFGDYWARARDLLDRDVLLDAAEAAGLERSEAAAALEEPRWLEAVAESRRRAASLGIEGVPAFIVDRQAIVTGAQPPEALERVLDRLGRSGRAGR